MLDKFNALVCNKTWELVPPVQPLILLVINKFFISNKIKIVLLAGLKPTLLLKDFIKSLVQTIMTHSVWWLNQLLSNLFSTLLLAMVGPFNNQMSIMPFYMDDFLKTFIWHNLRASLILIIPHVFVNFTKPFMASSKHRELGTINYANFLQILDLRTLTLTLPYLL